MTRDQDEYLPYDPARPAPVDKRLESEAAQWNREDSVTIQGFRAFSFLLHQGFQKINYAALTTGSDGEYVWISREHARAIGKELTGRVEYLALSFTCFEEDGPELLAEEVGADARATELAFAHKTPDEATLPEARGLARLATKLEARIVRWWCGEFVPGAIDAFCEELERLGNSTVVEFDVCDISRPEPDDQILHPGLEKLAASNRG